MREESVKGEAEVARVAALQHGVVTTVQLRMAGIDKSGVTRRVRLGRLHRVHQGVYAVGHEGLSREGRWMAAVLACGEEAVLSHGSAAALWGLLRPLEGPVHVSVPSNGGRRKRRGIRVHRCGSLGRPPGAVTVRNRIPVTAPWRTIEDMRGVVSPRLVRRAIRQAEIQRFALAPGTETDRTRSDLERAFLRLCHDHGLPAPQVNVRLGRWTVDFLWRAERLAVETDSWTYHRGSVAFEDDHARDLDLRRRGFAIRRYTGRQIEDEPLRVVADLAKALSS